MSKNNQYKLDSDAANDMLQNILKSCDIKPNDIPLNKLEVRHAKNYFHLHILKGLCILFFIITLLSPLAFARPTDDITVKQRAIGTLNILEHRHEGDYLYFLLNDEIDVDIEHCYMETDSGSILNPAKFDILINEVAFIYPDENATIYLYSTDNKLLKLYLSIGNQN